MLFGTPWTSDEIDRLSEFLDPIYSARDLMPEFPNRSFEAIRKMRRKLRGKPLEPQKKKERRGGNRIKNPIRPRWEDEEIELLTTLVRNRQNLKTIETNFPERNPRSIRSKIIELFPKKEDREYLSAQGYPWKAEDIDMVCFLYAAGWRLSDIASMLDDGQSEQLIYGLTQRRSISRSARRMDNWEPQDDLNLRGYLASGMGQHEAALMMGKSESEVYIRRLALGL